MKRYLILICLFISMTVPLLAQSPTPDQPVKFVAAGLAFFQSATPALQGWGALAMPLSDKILSWTAYDVSALPGDKIISSPGECLQLGGGCGAPPRWTPPKISYTMRTGIAVHIYTITKGVNLFGLGGAGIAAGGSNVVGSFAGGGFLDFALGKGWGAVLILEVNKNAMTGSDFVPRVGIRKKL